MATRPTQEEVDAYVASNPYGGWAPSQAQKYGSLEAMMAATPAGRAFSTYEMLAPGGTGSDVINMSGAPLPNYTNPLMSVQGAPTAPARQGFVDIDPLTGKPKMLPYTPGSGAGIFNQVINDPNRLRNLFGGPTGRAPGVGPTPLGGTGNGGGGGIPSTDPSQITGPGGVNPTPGPNPLPGVDPSGQLPSYILNQFGSNIAGALRGELPEDVQNLLAQQAAEYGVGSGTGGSQFAGYRGLRNLGLTSLDRMKEAEALIAGQFTKPGEKLALDQKERELADLRARADRAFGLEKQKLENELKLEQDKFAAYKNNLERELQLKELAGMGLKYGGGSVSGGFTGGSGGDVLFGSQPYGSRGLRRYGVTTIV